MARTLGSNATLAVAEKEGLEPVLILRFYWPGTQFYSTKSLTGLPYKPNIINFSGLNQSVKLDGVSAITVLNVTLSDDTGALKDLINVHDMTDTVVEGYIYYDGLSGGGPGTKIFVGRITSPYDWNEGKRTLDLTIETAIKSNKVGFSIDSGQFTVNNEIAVGKIWPIVFGKPAHVPAVLAQKKPSATLKYPLNMGGAIGQEELFALTGADLTITDWTTIQSYNVNNDEVIIDYGTMYVEDSSEFEQNTELEVIVDGVVFRGMFNDKVFTITEANATKYSEISFDARDTDDDDFENPFVIWLKEDFQGTLTDHYCYFYKATGKNTLIDTNGDEFITRKITKQDGRKIWLDKSILRADNYLPIAFDETIGQIDKVRALPENGLLVDITRFTNQITRMLKGRYNRNNSQAAPYGQLIETLKLIKFIKGAFWARKEGTEIRQWDANPDIYVANAVASDSLISVYGIRKYRDADTDTDIEKLVPIPSSYYSVNLDEATAIPTGEGPSNVTTLRFNIPLVAYKDQGWKDTIFVTVESSLTDNGVEAIKYILDTYTNLTTDITTFTAVAAQLANYEAHFAVLNHYDAITLCEEMAYQLRCGLLIDSGVVKIVNLAYSNSSQFTFTASKIAFQSLKATTSPEQDRISRFVGTYRPTYEPELIGKYYNKRVDRQRYYENNVDKIGLIEKEIDFFLFRNSEQVDEALEFWGNRSSKIWKMATFDAFHDTIKLELFDKVTFTLDYEYLGSSSCTGIVVGINNVLLSGVVSYTVLLSMEAGKNTEDDLFWNYTSISAPTNIADDLHEVNYDIQAEKERITIDDFIRQLQELTTRQRMLARVKPTSPTATTIYDDVKTMDIHTDGIDIEPQYANIPVDLTNNHIDLEEGELVHIGKDNNGAFYVPTRWAVHSAKIKSIGDNQLSVAFYDNRTETEYAEFLVELPYTLRRNTWDNQTIDGVTYNYSDLHERDATDGTNTETQVITPAYRVGDWIDIAWNIIDGGVWIDLNTDARAWAAEC